MMNRIGGHSNSDSDLEKVSGRKKPTAASRKSSILKRVDKAGGRLANRDFALKLKKKALKMEKPTATGGHQRCVKTGARHSGLHLTPSIVFMIF
jgi:hypothetical protein